MTVIPQPFKCNVCGQYRDRDANHWWLVWTVLLQDGKTVRIEMQLWNDDLAKEEGMNHCCGLKCAHALAGQLMGDALEKATTAQKEATSNEHS